MKISTGKETDASCDYCGQKPCSCSEGPENVERHRNDPTDV